MNKELMKQVGFAEEVELVSKNLCPFCKKEVKIEDFKDELSKKEYSISGLCQSCQDSFFG